jgi:ATP-dependent Clp protease ATP-binding subunit ClpB
VERVALRKETDAASRERLARLDKELAELKEQADKMRAQWQLEKDAIQKIRRIKEQMDVTRQEAERAERAADYNRAAQLKYGTLSDLDRQLKAEEARLAEVQKHGKMLAEEVTEDDVAEVVAKWTGIPVSSLLEGEVQKLIQMEERLHVRLVGQDEAITTVANAVRRARAGLQDPRRPIGSFIFMGPTGVGKTELARALAEFLFDDEDAMVRIDMSEYQERHTVARLIGAPPGYVGYEEGGQLTEAVRRKPYSVVLFDEIEKAHAEVFNVLLQVLDDGRLTDGQGRTVDFKNTVLIMTSNVGNEAWSVERGAGGEGRRAWSEEDARRSTLHALRATVRPEFLNRIDEVIIFHSLSKEHIAQIVDIQLAAVRRRLAERKIALELTPAAKELLAHEGYDPAYGARPLKRVIQRRLLDPLALAVLQGRFTEGQTIVVDAQGGEIAFRAEEAVAAGGR